MMKLPSIQQVLREAARTFSRFPLVLIDAFIWTVTVLIIVDYEGPRTGSVLFKILYATALGFPLLLATSLFAERRRLQKSFAWGVQAVGVLLLAAYALTVPSNIPFAPDLHVVRLLLLLLCVCLMVVVAPYANVRQLNGFWNYCRCLVERIVLAGVFSLTLYAGLALALVAIDELFGVNIPGKRYAELPLVILGIFATWFFLSGIPREWDSLDSRTDYPRVVRVFGQYILAPLMLVYFVILYAYITKIIIQWNWPKGTVGGLIFGFAASGIVAYLLLYPIRDTSESRWIERSARWFWIVMIPVIVVLELAVWRRVSEYGITENRYFALGLGVWLAILAVYFLASKAKSIKVIPASILVLALLVCVGPWGVFSVSERSQAGRLESLLTANGLLSGGRVQEALEPIERNDAEQISSIVRYLHDTHGYEAIQPWFSQSLMIDSSGPGTIAMSPDSVVGMLGVEYSLMPLGRKGELRMVQADPSEAVNIAGFDRMIMQRFSNEPREFKTPDSGLVCCIDSSLDVMTVKYAQQDGLTDSVLLRLRPFVDSLLETHGGGVTNVISPDMLSFQATTETTDLKVVFQMIEFRREGNGFLPLAYEVAVLYSQVRK